VSEAALSTHNLPTRQLREMLNSTTFRLGGNLAITAIPTNKTYAQAEYCYGCPSDCHTNVRKEEEIDVFGTSIGRALELTWELFHCCNLFLSLKSKALELRTLYGSGPAMGPTLRDWGV